MHSRKSNGRDRSLDVKRLSSWKRQAKTQALREIVRSMQQSEELLGRVGVDLLSELPNRERQALSAKRSEYAESIIDLVRLVRGADYRFHPIQVLQRLHGSCRRVAALKAQCLGESSVKAGL